MIDRDSFPQDIREAAMVAWLENCCSNPEYDSEEIDLIALGMKLERERSEKFARHHPLPNEAVT